jgi:hypothetical protein
MKRWFLRACLSVGILASFLFGIPVLAQSHIATLIPNQPLKTIAAQQIILNSGLPTETLLNGTTNAVTKGRDAINAYRYAHSMLYTYGWYRGISDDHTPLLEAMVAELEKQGFTSNEKVLQDKTSEVLAKLFTASEALNITEGIKEIGWK